MGQESERNTVEQREGDEGKRGTKEINVLKN